MVAGAGARRRWTFPAQHRVARRRSVPPAFWLPRWLCLPMMREFSMPCGTRVRSQADRSEFTSPPRQTRERAGRQRLKSQTRRRAWSTAFRPSPPAPLATSASHGWTQEKWTRKTILSGIPSTNGGATWLPESQLSGPVRGYDYILPSGFLFPFGNLFSIGIDNLGSTHVVWGEGSNYRSPGSIWYTHGR